MFPHQTPSRSLYLHLFPAVNGSPPVPPPPPQTLSSQSRRRLLGKQPQVQPGAWPGTYNKARSVEEHQASGSLSTPAADSSEWGEGAEGGGWGCRQQTDTTDTDISANTARGKCGGCLCCCHVGGQEAGSLLWFILINC